MLSNTENVGILLARSLDRSSNKTVNDTIERSNIRKQVSHSNNNWLNICSVVIDVKLPTTEELMTIDDVVFPEKANLASNDIINQAQVTIPGSIILRQFEKEGTAAQT